jgi:excisionase family DNA binding protein
MKNTQEVSQDWISISDAAKYLGVSKDTLRRWGKKGKITSSRTIGSHRRYSLSELQSFFTKPQKKYSHTPNLQKPIEKTIELPTSVQKISNIPTRTAIYSQPTVQNKQKGRFKSVLATLSLVLIIIILIFSSIFLYFNIQGQETPAEPLSPLVNN